MIKFYYSCRNFSSNFNTIRKSLAITGLLNRYYDQRNGLLGAARSTGFHCTDLLICNLTCFFFSLNPISINYDFSLQLFFAIYEIHFIKQGNWMTTFSF